MRASSGDNISQALDVQHDPSRMNRLVYKYILHDNRNDLFSLDPVKTKNTPPPDSHSSKSALYKFDSSSRGPRFILMSSRIAAWGQPPVSTARMRSSGSAPCLIKNSPSSFVKISFVTWIWREQIYKRSRCVIKAARCRFYALENVTKTPSAWISISAQR